MKAYTKSGSLYWIGIEPTDFAAPNKFQTTGEVLLHPQGVVVELDTAQKTICTGGLLTTTAFPEMAGATPVPAGAVFDSLVAMMQGLREVLPVWNVDGPSITALGGPCPYTSVGTRVHR
jgi:hypothetical protein